MPLILPESRAMLAHANRKDSTHGACPEASAYRMISYLKEAYPEIGTHRLTDKLAAFDEALVANEREAQGSLLAYLTKLGACEKLTLDIVDDAPEHLSISGAVRLAQAIYGLNEYSEEERRRIFTEMGRISGMAPGICISPDGRDAGWDEQRQQWSTNRFYDEASKEVRSCITSPAEALNQVATALLDRTGFLSMNGQAEVDERLRLFSFAGRMLELWQERQNGQLQRCSAGIQHELLFLLNGIYVVEGKVIDLPVDTASFLLNCLSEALAEELKQIEDAEQHLDLIWSWLQHREGLRAGDDSPIVLHLRGRYPEASEPDSVWKTHFTVIL